MKLTKKQVLQMFREFWTGHPGSWTESERREAWNDFTDDLCKTRQITLHQYETWDNPF